MFFVMRIAFELFLNSVFHQCIYPSCFYDGYNCNGLHQFWICFNWSVEWYA